MNQQHVTRVARMLWLGFEETALGALCELATDAYPASVRLAALTEKACWHEAFGRSHHALEAVDRMMLLGSEIELPDNTCAIVVDLLTSAGRLRDALTLLDDSPEDFRDSVDGILRRFNIITSDGASDAAVHQRGLQLVNAVFERHGCSPIELLTKSDGLTLDNIRGVPGVSRRASGPLVSVIVPAWNASDTIGYALRGLLDQTWTDIEVVVVDDGSTDDTFEIAAAIGDPRVRFERSPGKGAYVARNHGLACALGEFVTVHDADDWSHPEKLERQVRSLLEDHSLIASMSAMARTPHELYFGAPSFRPAAKKVISNYSSLLVRQSAFDVLGQWDTPAAAADTEFIERCRRFYGRGAVGQIMPEVPLRLMLRHRLSLTSASNGTGILTLHHVAGSRRHYRSEWARWHARRDFVASLPFAAGTAATPFLRPRLLDTERSAEDRFDVVVLGDFSGRGTHGSVVEEIRAQTKAGLRTGLMHIPVYDREFERHRDPSPLDLTDEQLFGVVDGEHVRFLNSGEDVSADVLLVRSPQVLQDRVAKLPGVRAGATVVVIDESVVGPDPAATLRGHEVERWVATLRILGYEQVTWRPAGPEIRGALLETHSGELSRIDLDDDWEEVIDLEAWKRRARPAWNDDRPIRIGRHAPEHVAQWPGEVEQILAAYPDDPRFEVRILGSASIPSEMLGSLPRRWRVLRYDTVTAPAFLRDLDVYVHHSQRGYSAGVRAALEALAAGVPVVTGPEIEEHFGDAVVAVEPERVADEVQRLMSDRGLYDERVSRGFEVIRQRYNWDRHVDQIERVRSRISR